MTSNTATASLSATDQKPSQAYRQPPANLLAEQMLLGAVLINNEHLNRVDDFLRADHFYEAVHQRIYEAVHIFQERGVHATPVTLKHYFDKDAALEGVGGADYLARLASMATTTINILDYGRTIYDLALRRQLIHVGEQVVNEAYDQDIGTTAAEQIEQAEQSLFTLASEGNHGTGFRPLKQSLTAAIQKAEIAYRHKEKVTGVSSGFTDLDHLLGGLQDSDLLILAGRPSMGKTALAINLAINAAISLQNRALEKKKDETEEETPMPSVGFFSLEMSAEQLAARILSVMSGVNSGGMRTGFLDEDDFAKIVEANRTLQNLAFFIDDTPALSISALRTRARRLKRRYNLSLLVIDYLQLVRSLSRGSEGNRVQEVSEITQGLKAIAKELNIPVIALSQLSRAVEQREDKRPQLSDLRESGSIEQDADIVMFIYRDEYYVGRKRPEEGSEAFYEWQTTMDRVRNTAEVIIAKQRNGPIGHVLLHYDSHTTKFANHAGDNGPLHYMS